MQPEAIIHGSKNGPETGTLSVFRKVLLDISQQRFHKCFPWIVVSIDQGTTND
jgi:hypothetical protein